MTVAGQSAAKRGRCSRAELEQKVLEIVERCNKEGKAPTNKEVLEALNERYGAGVDRRCVSRILRGLEDRQVLVRVRGRGNKVYNVLKNYSHLLGGRPSIMGHVEDLAAGLEVLATAGPPQPSGRALSAGDVRRAYYALQHVLRGSRFSHLKKLLEEGDLEAFRREAAAEADRLRELARSGERGDLKELVDKLGSCKVCGMPPSVEEAEVLARWWGALGLGGYDPDTGTKRRPPGIII